MLDLRKRIFIIAGVAAGLFLAIGLWLYVSRDRGPASSTASPTDALGGEVTGEPALPGAVQREPAAPPLGAPVVVDNPDELYVQQLAAIFVERFGSYSNQNDNRHLTDAAALATARMAEWLRGQGVALGKIYQGLTTKVVARSLKGLAGEQATVLVDVQEVRDSDAGRQTTYRSGRVELMKVEGEWRVDGLYWE